MHAKINEPVQVLVSFHENKVNPLFFRFRNRDFRIKKVHLVHVEKDGRSKIYHFAVTDDTSYYKLSFWPDSMQWILSEQYSDAVVAV